MADLIRVRISDPDHPHYPEHGWLTGKIIQMKFGDRTQMAEMQIEGCIHGTDACFVSKGQVTALNARRPSPPSPEPR